MLCAFLLMSLTACGESGTSVTGRAPIPGDIKVCLNKLVPKPNEIKTKAQIAGILADLRRNDVSKTLCGRRLIALYEKQI